jgi:hypothetical protein
MKGKKLEPGYSGIQVQANAKPDGDQHNARSQFYENDQAAIIVRGPSDTSLFIYVPAGAGVFLALPDHCQTAVVSGFLNASL